MSPAARRAAPCLRDATRRDVETLVEIDRTSAHAPWSAEVFFKELDHALASVRVAEIDGALVGFLVDWTVAGTLEVQNVCVRPEMRRRGVGRALLDDAIARGVEAGCSRVELEVRESNRRARGLYASAGFVEVGRRKRYYSDGEAAVLLTLELPVCHP